MANIFTIKTGGRGRPLTIDPEKLLAQFMKAIPQARARLAKFRETTKGERNAEILGTETTLPKSIKATVDVLEELQQGQQINYATARELRQNLRVVQQLASRQERVYSRALSSALLRQFEQDITYANKNASRFTRRQNTQILQTVKSLAPRKQQKFFMSRGYQSPKATGSYQRAKNWASNDIKNNYTRKEIEEMGLDYETNGKGRVISVELTDDEALAWVRANKSAREVDMIEVEDEVLKDLGW